MRHGAYHYRWEWHLAATPEQLWPLVADTDRFDRDAGMPALASVTSEGTETRAVVQQFGVALEYLQDPFEWSRPHFFAVRRLFRSGPVGTLRIEARLRPEPAGGTHLVYEVWATPRNVLGTIGIPLQIGRVLARRFDRTFRTYDTLACEVRPDRATDRPHLVRGGRDRLAARQRQLLDSGADPAVAARLATTVCEADDTVVGRLRPYALADHWGADRRRVLETCLLATRFGLLQFRWDVLCPTCRVAKASVSSLGDLPASVHCQTCRVDYDTNFARSVELTFTPSPSIRRVEHHEYCVGGPTVSPHVVHQQRLDPGQAMTVGPLGEEGRYRLRAITQPGAAHVAVAAEGFAEATVALSGAGWPGDEVPIARLGRLTVRNDRSEPALVALERTAWSDQAVTAAEVTAMQQFRDLFATEALRPGDRISVGSMAIVFSDLCGSTALYQQIGDAVAFGRVMDHFDVLRRCIRAEGGAVVKTIGDAVMAVFPTPAPAIRSMLQAQHDLTRSAPSGVSPLRLKAGVHVGPCIAVNLNGQLDYFGSTVNRAARLEGRSRGGDVVFSTEVHDDPEVRELLADPGRLEVTRLRAALPGFEHEFDLWQVRPVDSRPGADPIGPDAVRSQGAVGDPAAAATA